MYGVLTKEAALALQRLKEAHGTQNRALNYALIMAQGDGIEPPNVRIKT